MSLTRPILLTAFEPFGSAHVNASQEAARLLAEADPRLVCITLPVVRGEAERIALAALNDLTAAGTPPALMISLGEAGPEPLFVRLEKVAINWDDFRIPDNAGDQPRDTAIAPDGPAAYFSTVPVAQVAEALRGKTPIPVRVSLSAGAYLCNHLAYSALHALAAQGPPVCPYLFVHIPAWRPESDLSLEAIAATVRDVIDAIA